MMKYSEEQIQSMVMILDSIEIKGIQNAKRIIMIKSIIDQGIKEGDQTNGSDKHC